MLTAEQPVLMERRGALAVVTLNRPERRNGVTVAMCAQLHEVLLALASADARVIVLRGAGSDFSVGADLGGSPGGPAAPTLERLADVYHAATLLHTMPQVTIAAVDGGCAGAAMGWACACDLRFASDRARFSTAFLRLGVSGDMAWPGRWRGWPAGPGHANCCFFRRRSRHSRRSTTGSSLACFRPMRCRARCLRSPGNSRGAAPLPCA